MPHLLSEDEIEKFFEICDMITPQKEHPGKHLVLPAYFCFFTLLWRQNRRSKTTKDR